ncbi:tyrosine--tRNA ligase [Winogradskya humida]|uniref:Tyrosine--tRNA ligase n=1 Tax=Winogradskya humida TaxID=113566 RepID=A0ABQ4A121_9ACTN|nr:tyrosine--tRNA ligase [Actinoplanes humidus]GIE24544.1 tyrosine--tRNA ligase 2 [Actinoplanes humidus]
MTRLHRSVSHGTALLSSADLSDGPAVRELLDLTTTRRRLDLSDLSPADQAALATSRATEVLPSAAALAARLALGRPLRVKFTIEPQGTEFHLGNVVPLLVVERLRRMGHHVDFVAGDVTVRITDASQAGGERPRISDADVGESLAAHRRQVAPFLDISAVTLRRNSAWLEKTGVPRLIELAASVPLARTLDRAGLRERLAGDREVRLDETLYPLVKALDSVELDTDVEVGGVYQRATMAVTHEVTARHAALPQLGIATPLIEGIDGTGALMSARTGNHVALTASAGEVYAALVAVPDHLVAPYLRALTEWDDAELDATRTRVAAGTATRDAVRHLLAGELTAAIHGVDAAMAARAAYRSLDIHPVR